MCSSDLLTKDQLDEVYQSFTSLADRKKGVRNDEILGIIHQVTGGAVPVARA